MIDSLQPLVTFLRGYHHKVGDGSLSDDLVPRDLPHPLRQIYLKFGKWTKPWSPLAAQNYLLPVEELVEEDGYICFLRENQNCWECWCRLGDDGVYCDSESGRGRKNAEQVHELIEQFLISHCLLEAVMSSPEIVYLHDFKPPNEVIPVSWQELYMRGRFVDALSPLDFYFAPDPGLMAMRTPLQDFWLATYERGLNAMLNEDIEAMQVSPRPSGPYTYVGNSREPKKPEPD